MRLVHADAVVLGNERPVRDGAVVVDDRGTIHDVGRAAEVFPRHAGLAVTRIQGAVLPGLVNAHTHIELSALRSRVPGGHGFVPWVEALIEARARLGADESAAAIDAAVDELDRAGTVAVGEVTNTLAAAKALEERGIRGWLFHEVFGLDRAAAMARLVENAEVHQSQRGTPRLRWAPAPHTLYTTHKDVVRAALTRAREGQLRTSLHLAEHAGERTAIETGQGDVVTWLGQRVPHAPANWPRVPLFAYAAELGALAPHVLLVHLTDATRDELAQVSESGAHVVLCPRSNETIESRLPPLPDVLAAGVEPALGTDSLASNESLDVLADARTLLDRFPSVSAETLVRMATWNGAQALGLSNLGRIEKGAYPGLLAIEGNVGDDPARFVLEQVKAPRRWIARSIA